jgi:hypothetical protein
MNSRFRFGTSNPFDGERTPPVPHRPAASAGRKTGEERQGIVLDLPGNLLDRAFPLQQGSHIVAGKVIISAGQPGDGGAHDTIIGFLHPFLLTAPPGNHREITSKKAVKVVEPKRMEGKSKREHKDAVFFVDVILALTVL